MRNFNFVVDFFQASLIGTVVTKKEMTSLFHTKLKLDTFVAEAKVGKERMIGPSLTFMMQCYNSLKELYWMLTIRLYHT